MLVIEASLGGQRQDNRASRGLVTADTAEFRVVRVK
jgi:hypothetical protein